MSEGVDLKTVSATLRVLLERAGKPVIYQCAVTKQDFRFEPEDAVTVNGLLPAFLTAADAVWHEATGRRFTLDVVTDPEAIFGYVVRGAHSGSFSTLMLSLMEVLVQIEQSDCLLVNELIAVWIGASRRSAAIGAFAAPAAVAA